MLPEPLRRWLFVLEAVAFATLVRSVAFDRWITVFVSALLLAGAVAAHRGRSWGVALAFAASFFFPVAFLLGMAPAWFVAVGAIAAAPFALTWRAFVRSDREATRWLAALSAGVGTSIALFWKVAAWPLFMTFPSLLPSAYPQHGLLVSALMATGVFALLTRWRAARAATDAQAVAYPTGVRIGAATRISTSDPAEADAEWEAHEALEAAGSKKRIASDGRRP